MAECNIVLLLFRKNSTWGMKVYDETEKQSMIHLDSFTQLHRTQTKAESTKQGQSENRKQHCVNEDFFFPLSIHHVICEHISFFCNNDNFIGTDCH